MIAYLSRLLMRRLVLSPPATLRLMLLLGAVLLYGSSGFLYFELPENPQLSWADALWYSVVTVTTVGYGDFFPKTPGGRFLVAVPLMFFGIGLLGYVLSVAAAALVQAKTKEWQGMAEIKLKGHLVLFNFPNLGKVARVLDELVASPRFGRGREVVLVDEELSELPAELARRGLRFVRGNPSRDETLGRAGVDHAAWAIVLSKRPGDPHSDDQAVAISLAIERRQPNVTTIVECVDFTTEELLRKAGSDGIVCTSRFDAHFLSHELLNPGMQEVLEKLTSNQRGQQLHVTPYTGAATTYGQLAERTRAQGHVLIGLQRDGTTELNPAPDAPVGAGVRVVSIGGHRLNGLS